jgi:adenosylcobinamide-GDP ribazoletransferase
VREKKLAIMKDVRVGAFGALTLIVDVAAKLVAFERILSTGSILWIVVVFVLSRGMMVDLITRFPYARKEEGMSQPFIKGASFKHRVVSHILCLIFCLPFGIIGLGAFFLSWVTVRIFGWRCHKQFGGITGDLIGASNEIVEFVLLMSFALCGTGLNEYAKWTWLIS